MKNDAAKLSLRQKIESTIGFVFFVGMLVLIVVAHVYVKNHPINHHRLIPPIKQIPPKSINTAVHQDAYNVTGQK